MNLYQITSILAKNAFLFPDIQSFTLDGECSYQSYLYGAYWDRSWVMAGADPDVAGALTAPRMNVKELSATHQDDGCICRRFAIVVENDDCVDCDPQPDPVSIISSYVDSLARLQQYEVNEEIQWLVPERAAALSRQGYTVSRGPDKGVFPIELTRRETIGRPTQDKGRMEVIICFEDPVSVMDDIFIPPSLGTNSCPTCPPPKPEGTPPQPVPPPLDEGWIRTQGGCWLTIT